MKIDSIIARAKKQLARKGIKTISDLDAYRANNDPFNSRNGVLKSIVGNEGAIWVMNELAINQCCGKPQA